MRRTLRTRLQEIRNTSTMETASFHSDNLPVVLKTQEEVNIFIKRSIQLWIRTWITGMLDDILEEFK